MASRRFAQPFVEGAVETPCGAVPRLASSLAPADRRGAVRARLGIGRMSYRVEPGLYALGAPDRRSPILVTANYKLTVDRVRSALPGLDAWLLVLDSNGINVWCAAGKGTFGTDELIRRIHDEGLAAVVDHRRLILPQLGAPGVAGFRVTKATGFRVTWGPVEIDDLPAFLAAGRHADEAMRRKRFPLRERAVLIPVEISATLPALAVLVPLLVLIGALAAHEPLLAAALRHGVPAAASLLAGIVAGAVLTPLLLPWLPGRAFAAKGLGPGLLVGLALAAALAEPGTTAGLLEAASWVVLTTTASAFLAMNFTGSSTYTSLSGVRREMRLAVPLEIGGLAVALVLWISGFVVG